MNLNAGNLVINPCYSVESCLAFPRPQQAQIRHMPLFTEVSGGAWKESTLWEWMTLVSSLSITR